MTDYQTFLTDKNPTVTATGFDVPLTDINPMFFPFQRAIIQWALQLGKAALFEECGLGKGGQSLEWAKHVAAHTSGKVLILVPLAVAHQLVNEGEKFSVPVTYCASQDETGDANIIVTNYEKLKNFDPTQFAGVVLDESSILKNYTGKTKQKLIDAFRDTPYKLACTATPAPNDYLELGNHAEFLDVMPSNEMIARWFINDTNKAGNYRLKRPAEADFWHWVTSWAVCIRKPSDLGSTYKMPGYDLPALNLIEHFIPSNRASIDAAQSEGLLFPDTQVSATTMHTIKRASAGDRSTVVQSILAGIDPGDAVVIWCNTNYEADALLAAVPDALEVRGSHRDKEDRLMQFSDGTARILITKPDIAGFGLNWQHCHEHICAGFDFSFEKFYQQIRRSYRYGQTEPVNVHLVVSEGESNILQTIRDKQAAFEQMQAAMSAAMQEHGLFRNETALALSEPKIAAVKADNWTLHLGDCVTTAQDIPDNSIHLSVYSPPFSNLYIYSDSQADMGNSRDTAEFMAHYRYFVREKLRITLPGRLTAVHVKDLPLYKGSSGWHGVEDFSGAVTRLHTEEGWVYHSRITIWKDPVHEMQKTNSHGLLHKNFAQRTQVCRTGLPDYMLIFAKPDYAGQGKPILQWRQPGDYIGTDAPQEAVYSHSRYKQPAWYPGTPEDYSYSIQVWQRYASPVWFDIDQTDVLNYQQAKALNDEKHICPLQLGIIRRCIDLWSNEGEMILDPFNGIGSTGYVALQQKRQYTGIELKESYWHTAQKHLEWAARQMRQPTLWDLLPEAKTS